MSLTARCAASRPGPRITCRSPLIPCCCVRGLAPRSRKSGCSTSCALKRSAPRRCSLISCRNILPRTIVERMRQGERVIADHIPEATILFSDLVDFTSLGARYSPEETVALLGDIFSRFDGLAARRGLEKIKTTGDGYMVASG